MRCVPVLLAATVALVAAAAPLEAQNARAQGNVRDTSGRAIRGATIRAVNPEASPSEFTSTTNNRGQWAMIGLRIGTWTFVAEAPGFGPVEVAVPVRAGSAPPLTFTLERDPTTLPGALDRDILRQLDEALALREAGRYDEALTTYVRIRGRNPKLTHVHLIIADLYRHRAEGEAEPAARRALLEQAAGAYAALLALDAEHREAGAALEEVRQELAALP